MKAKNRKRKGPQPHLVESSLLSWRAVTYITNYVNIFLQWNIVELKPYVWVWEIKSGVVSQQRVIYMSTDELHTYRKYLNERDQV